MQPRLTGHAVRGIEKEREMTKRWIAPVLGLALALSLGNARPAGAFLKKPKAGAPAAKTTKGTTTVSGMVKGAPNGKVYTVMSGKKATQVDTSHAQARSKGKFASIQAGAYIRATGTMKGGTLDATSVEVVRPAGGGKKPAKGGKMGSKTMSGGPPSKK
jgi:hypothetical protein